MGHSTAREPSRVSTRLRWEVQGPGLVCPACHPQVMELGFLFQLGAVGLGVLGQVMFLLCRDTL